MDVKTIFLIPAYYNSATNKATRAKRMHRGNKSLFVPLIPKLGDRKMCGTQPRQQQVQQFVTQKILKIFA